MLKLKNFVVRMPGEDVKGVDLEVKKGEIVGIGGLAGQGKLGIANGIMGIYPAKGEVLFEGKPLKMNDPKGSITAGLGFVSEDRRGIGLLLESSIELNTVFTCMQIKNSFLKRVGPIKFKDTKKIRAHTKRMIKELDIRCTSSEQRVGSLSGGNQQKVILARWLITHPQYLILDEPTRGIDIGTKVEIQKLVLKLAAENVSVTFISSEIEEMLRTCSRLIVMKDRNIAGELTGGNLTQRDVMRVIAGGGE